MLKKFAPEDYEVVEFTNHIHPRIKVQPRYFNQGFCASALMVGRRAVLDGLLEALKRVPQTYGFLIWDVYRPREVQRKLFDWMSEKIRKQYPDLSEEDHYREVLKYVALPAEAGDEYCSPHLSGGAIDLTFYDLKTGQELNMGTPFDDCSERAHSGYFNLKSFLSTEETQIKQRRDFLRTAMESAGFTAYHYEWWHFDVGNMFWANVTGQAAVFGPLFGDDEWPSL
ncbi:M15 family metallopeptidase [Legionella jamestowniensis]|uniref:D-alanyl-D-alanine dipeptidase n=1 Tax=Legionella jamestowniensis TaxID=455 RepID=A0A0W0UK15_9GAMM|nr:M15 family metallopeptidase [Legionella jamestowniensis]KTD08076.1 D-alanyl-D-alanine dipeptidase [Legionella jamestowniensis]OCH97355.1 hypothetical protein A8135_03620 [Legionella jamestowniensis]SFM05626.1 D-alanyl-D-alanine dipeptidase [Legionella jamestowniensis DSM 19215]